MGGLARGEGDEGLGASTAAQALRTALSGVADVVVVVVVVARHRQRRW